MYLSHYNLTKKPFQLTTDPKFLWLGEKHKEALATLRYGVVDQKGFLLVTGDVGTGKTTLINALLESIEEDTLVANITDPALDLVEFFNFIALSFDISKKFDSKIDFIVYFSKFLKKVYSENRNVLLIIDEVHRLSKEVLEHIRLLSNIELPQEKLINIFFVGQNEIYQTLALPECRALRQRVSLVYQIEPLSENETLAYIKHRLKIAGTDKSIFTLDAVREIYHFSKGYPRLINTICDHALLTGYARDFKRITPNVITECAQQFNSIGETWNNFQPTSHEQPNTECQSYSITCPFLTHRTEERASSETPDNRIPVLPRPESTQKDVNAQEEVQNYTADSSTVSIATNSQKRKFSWTPVASFVKHKQKRRFFWASALFLALIILAITGLYQKALTTKNYPLKSTTLSSKITASTPGKSDRHPPSHDSQINADEIKPVHEIETASSQKADLSKPNILDQAKSALHNKNFKQAIELFEQDIAQHSTNATAIKWYYSKALQGQAENVLLKNPDAAETLLSTAIEVDPGNAEAHFDLGRLYTKSKNYPKAIIAYQKAANLNHRSPGAFYNLGFIYASIKDFANAEKMFIHVVELKPSYLDKALFNLAAVQQKQGKYQQCIENLEKSIKNNPKNQRAQQYLNQLKK